jgi:hypothetical protein
MDIITILLDSLGENIFFWRTQMDPPEKCTVVFGASYKLFVEN